MNEFSPFANIYGEAKTGHSTTPQATASEVFWAGMEQENDLYNLAQAIDKPNFEPDPEFKVLDHFYSQKLPHEFLDHLLASTSQKEFDFRLGRVQQELKNKAILASAGAGGFAASLGAGVLSPTIFIPFAGAGARGAKLVGQAMALGAVGASASEAALYFNQETRTEMEVVGGVAMGTLLSGGLGIAFARLDARAQAKLARDVEDGQRYVEQPTVASDTGTASKTKLLDPDFAEDFAPPAAAKVQSDFFEDTRAVPQAADGLAPVVDEVEDAAPRSFRERLSDYSVRQVEELLKRIPEARWEDGITEDNLRMIEQAFGNNLPSPREMDDFFARDAEIDTGNVRAVQHTGVNTFRGVAPDDVPANQAAHHLSFRERLSRFTVRQVEEALSRIPGAKLDEGLSEDNLELIENAMQRQNFSDEEFFAQMHGTGMPIEGGRSVVTSAPGVSMRSRDNAFLHTGAYAKPANELVPDSAWRAFQAMSVLKLIRTVGEYALRHADAKPLSDEMALFILREVGGAEVADFIRATKARPAEYLLGLEDELYRSDVGSLYSSGLLDDTLTLADALSDAPTNQALAGMRKGPVDDMADNTTLSTIPDAAPIARNVSEDFGSAGAASTKVRNASGNVRPRNAAAAALFDAGGKLNPLYRMMNNKLFPSLRDAAAKLDDGGLQQAGLETMQPSAAGGTVQSRVRLGDVAVYKFAFKLDEAYLNYLYPGQKFTRPQVAALAAQVRSFFGKQPAGKMSFPEFKARAHDDYVQGIDNPDTNALKPAIKEFYEHYEKMQEEYLIELQQTGAEVKPLFKVAKKGDGLESGAEHYLHEVYDKNLVGDRSDEFIKDMADQNEKELQSWFQKSYARYEARRAKARTNLELAKLGPEGVNKAFRETQEDLDVLLESPEFINYASSRKEIRDQARLEGWSREELKAALDDLNANVDDNTQSILDSIVESRSALSNIRKLGGDAESRIETLAEQLQKVEDRYYAKIESGLPGLRSLDLRVDSLVSRGEKGVAKATKTMQGQLDNLRKIEQARIEQMRKSRSSPKTMARLEERHVKAQARLDMAEAKMREAEQKNLVLGDKADALNEARVALVDATVEMLRRNGSRADELAAKIEAQEARILTPEEYDARLQKMQDEYDDMEIEFERRIGDKGGEITGEGQANFREKAVEEATYFYQKLMGSDARPSEVFLRQSERGPALERMMKLPYNVKQKYLVKDLELLSRVYNRSMAPDLEIWRAFEGSVNGDTVIKQIDQETINLQLVLSQATHVKLPKQFMLKAAAFGEKVKNRLASLEDGDTLFIDEKNFASEAKEGFTEMTPEVRSALSKYINDMRDAGVRDFDIAIQRLRHTRGVPEDANSIMYRTGRVIKDMNVVTLMGKVMLSSIPDLARPVAKYGLGHVMSKAWLPMITGLRDNQGRSFRIASKEINRNLGINLEPVMHSRAQSMFDVADEVAQGKTILERGVKFASNKMGIVAMFDYWTAGMKSVAAAATHATLAEYIPRVGQQLMAGKELVGDELKMVVKLRDLGLRDTDILRIAQQMAAPNGMEVFSNGAKIANPDLWSDPGAYRAYAAALQTDVNRMIITPGLERPNWVDENLAYSMVAQFKSFTFASTQRVLMAGLQGNEPYMAQAALFSLALGGVSYYASAYANGGKSLERANKLEMDDWIYESVDRSGLLGVFSWPQQIGEQIPALNQYAVFGGEDKQFRRPYGGFGALLGPTASKAEDMLALAKTFDENGLGNGNERRIKNLFVPYQNVFYIQKLFSLLDEN